MSLGRGGEGAAAVPGRCVRWRAHSGMQVQRNDTAGLSKRRSGGSCAETDGGGGTTCGPATDAVRSRSRAGSSALFGDRELRCGRDHGALSDVQIADGTSRCGLDARRRRDDRRLQSLISRRVRSTQVGRRSHHGVLHLRCDSRNLGGRSQRNGGNREPRLLPLVGPRHDVGQGYVALQLDVGRRHDGL